MERLDPIDVEFIINSDDVKKDVQKVRNEIKGVGDEAAQAGKKAVASSRKWNGLGNSISQITRELPAFTYSVQTGFLAISNNLPILADEIARVKAENEALNLEGKKGIPVWKQVASNLFSWTNLLSIGITLLTIYGHRVVEYIGNLIKGKEALDATKKAQEALNKAFDDSNYQKAIKDVLELKGALKLAKEGYVDQEVVLKRYNETLGGVLGKTNDINTAEETLIKKTPAYIKAMLYKAAATQATADAAKALAENQKKQFELGEDIKKAEYERDRASDQKVLNVAYSVSSVVTEKAAKTANVKRLEDELEALEKEGRELQEKQADIIGKLEEGAAKIAREAGIDWEGNDKRTSVIVVSKREQLLEKLAQLDAEYARKQLNSDQEELQALRDKFATIRKLVEGFNAKNKKNPISLGALENTLDIAEQSLLYSQETRNIEAELKQQKAFFEEYEVYKKDFGAKAAKERYAQQLKDFKSYAEVIRGLYDKNADAFNAVASGTATGGQAERVRLIEREADEELKIRSNSYNQLLTGLKSYEQERNMLIERYQEQRSQLLTKGEDVAVQELEKRFKKALDTLDLSAAKEQQRYLALFGDVNQMSDTVVQEIIQNARIMVQELNSIGVSAEVILKINKAIDELEKGRKNNKASKIRDLAYLFQEVASSIEGAFAELLNNVADTIGGMSTALQTLNDSSATNISKLTSVVGLFSQAFITLRSITKWLRKDKGLDRQIAINKELLEQFKMENEINRIHRERNELLREANVLIDSYYKESYSSAFEKQRESLEVLEKSIDALATGAAIQGTGKTSGFFGIGAKDKHYNFSLDTLLQRLLGDNDKWFYGSNLTKTDAGLDAEKALRKALEAIGKTAEDVANFSTKEWLEFFEVLEASGRVIEESTKELLATAKKGMEEYQAALSSMRSIIKDFAGELSSQLSTSLKDAFSAGEDAAEHFRKSINRVLLNIFMQDLVNSQFRSFFQKLQKEMEASMGADGDQNWIDDIERFSDQISPRLEAAMQAMQVFDDQLKAAGYEGFDSEDSPDAKGLQGAIRRELTEETASELTGLFRGQYDITKRHLQLSEKHFEQEKKHYDATLHIMQSSALIEQNTANTVIELKIAVSELKAINKHTKPSQTTRDLGK